MDVGYRHHIFADDQLEEIFVYPTDSLKSLKLCMIHFHDGDI